MNSIKSTVFLSFIIPAHNSEKTLLKCIESIEKDVNFVGSNMNFTDTLCELIIIENGSDDRTLDIAHNLQSKYPNILLEFSEKGVSKARNRGIEVARGKKIVFVDSDDIWVQGSIGVIIKQASTAACDLLMYGYYKEEKEIVHEYSRMNQVFSEELDDFKRWLLVRPTLRMQVWAKVFEKSVINKFSLRFNENLSYSEDSEFLIRYVILSKKMAVFSEPIYRYSCVGSSAVRAYNPYRMQAYIRSLEIMKKDLEQESVFVKEAYLEYVLAHFNLIAVHDIFDLQIKDSFANKLRKMNKLKVEPMFKEALDKIPLRKCLMPQLFPEACIKCRLGIVGGVICYVKAYFNHRQQIAASK